MRRLKEVICIIFVFYTILIQGCVMPPHEDNRPKELKALNNARYDLSVGDYKKLQSSLALHAYFAKFGINAEHADLQVRKLWESQQYDDLLIYLDKNTNEEYADDVIIWRCRAYEAIMLLNKAESCFRQTNNFNGLKRVLRIIQMTSTME
mgnify:CR=1 FL=1